MDGYEPSDDDYRDVLEPDPRDDESEEIYDCPIHGKLDGIDECPLC